MRPKPTQGRWYAGAWNRKSGNAAAVYADVEGKTYMLAEMTAERGLDEAHANAGLMAGARELAQAVVDGFTYDPGTSDLDNEQPITVRMTLGQYRKAQAAIAKE